MEWKEASLYLSQETQMQYQGKEGPLEEDDNPLQYSCLENPMDRGALVSYNLGGQQKSDTT